jgi:hypothetical protein
MVKIVNNISSLSRIFNFDFSVKLSILILKGITGLAYIYLPSLYF